MKPILLVRHAEAEHHVRALTGGWTDSDLTELGMRQAGLLAERLAQELGTARPYLGCSPLRRAVRTAEILAARLGAEPHIYPQLVDLNNGIAAGMTHDEARQHAIPPSEPIEDWQPYPQAESWRQLFERTSAFMESLTSGQLEGQGSYEVLLLVSHAAVMEAIVSWWLGLGVNTRTSFAGAPASLSVLRIGLWNERRVERLNDIAHLYAAGLADRVRLG